MHSCMGSLGGSWHTLIILVAGFASLPSAAADDYEAPTQPTENGACPWAREGPLAPLESSLRCPPLVDDQTAKETGHWAPWSYPPVCAYPLDEGDRKYCTFTYHGFRGDLSISIITSPETAAEATTLLEEQNPQWTGNKGAGDVTVGGEQRSYFVDDVPGRGKGAFAARDIRRGELIMDEWAVLVGMLNAPPGIDRSHLKILDAFAFERLGDQQRKRVSEMATAPDRDMINGIFHTNSFGITLADEANHRALFPEIARINHDCRPSCHVRYSRHELRMEVFAYRDIKAGEELSVAYTPLNLPTKARQEAIQGWGFNCTCNLCTEPELSETSDRNRQQIQDLVRDMAKVENRNRDAMRVITDQLVALMETEELTAMMGDLYGMLAVAYSKLNHLEEALKYSILAVENQVRFRGKHHAKADEMRTLLSMVRGAMRKAESEP